MAQAEFGTYLNLNKTLGLCKFAASHKLLLCLVWSKTVWDEHSGIHVYITRITFTSKFVYKHLFNLGVNASPAKYKSLKFIQHGPEVSG